MEIDDFAEASEAWEQLIRAGDIARLTPDEIKQVAEAISELPLGESFAVTVRSVGLTQYQKTILVNYS